VLEVLRWVVERFFRHLHRFLKLRLRTDWYLPVQDALLNLARAFIYLNIFLKASGHDSRAAFGW
jgi:hypothetical protein